MIAEERLDFCFKTDSTLYILDILIQEVDFDLSLDELAEKRRVLGILVYFMHIVLLAKQLVLYHFRLRFHVELDGIWFLQETYFLRRMR